MKTTIRGINNMKNEKHFSAEEKRIVLDELLKEKENDEFNKREAIKEKRVKIYLIMIECGLIIGLLLITSFNWKFDWMLNINNWLTNIIVPLLIFNLVNSVWMIIERYVKKIRVWIRLIFYFSSLIVTFLVSSSLQISFNKSMPIWIIIVSVFLSIVCVTMFIINSKIKQKEASKVAEYYNAIIDEIIKDIETE